MIIQPYLPRLKRKWKNKIFENAVSSFRDIHPHFHYVRSKMCAVSSKILFCKWWTKQQLVNFARWSYLSSHQSETSISHKHLQLIPQHSYNALCSNWKYPWRIGIRHPKKRILEYNTHVPLPWSPCILPEILWLHHQVVPLSVSMS